MGAAVQRSIGLSKPFSRLSSHPRRSWTVDARQALALTKQSRTIVSRDAVVQSFDRERTDRHGHCRNCTPASKPGPIHQRQYPTRGSPRRAKPFGRKICSTIAMTNPLIALLSQPEPEWVSIHRPGRKRPLTEMAASSRPFTTAQRFRGGSVQRCCKYTTSRSV